MSSEVSIGYSSVDGRKIKASDSVRIYCNNEWSSDHGLWCELHKDDLFNSNVGEVYSYLGDNTSKLIKIGDETRTYFPRLNVDGPGYTGCKGTGGVRN